MLATSASKGVPRNVADLMFAQAAEAPRRVALHYPTGFEPDGSARYESLTYAELANDVNALARAFREIGIAEGERTAVMVKPGREFFVVMFALFRARAVPVLIDPGIDRGVLKQCLDEAAPGAFIGIPLAHAARLALGWARRSVRTVVTVGTRWAWGGHRYDALLVRGAAAIGANDAELAAVLPVPVAQDAPGAWERVLTGRTAIKPTSPTILADPLAAILFTSGSTGIPKGVEYTHGNFIAQVALLQRALAIEPGAVDLPTFAPFALFDPALGVTTVLPPMDFANPGKVDPKRLQEAIERFDVTMMFGSPAVMAVLARHHEATGARFPTLQKMLSAGAPLRPEVTARVRKLLGDDATLHTPYGATECLPVALVESRDIIAVGGEGTPRGDGILLGTPVDENTVRIIATTDEPIAQWSEVETMPRGAIGEITVAGPTATRGYFQRPGQTAAAKILELTPEAPARIVHRMGDCGYFDARGRLWYVGRKSHRVVTRDAVLYPEMVEGIFNAEGGVARTALVGVGARGTETPVICVELEPAIADREWPRIAQALQSRAGAHTLTRGISTFLRHPAFPVDIRHNAKIAREKLARWAATQLA